MSMITVYDRGGNAIAELKASAARAWVLNEYGRATVELSLREAAVKETFLQFGNYLLIEHETLGNWGGVIDTPRVWQGGKVTVNAYSGEYLLGFRRGPLSKKMVGAAGVLYTQIIRMANSAEDLLIREGEIYTGGASVAQVVDVRPLYDAVCALAKQGGCDWSVTPARDSAGRLIFSANWYKQAGADRVLALWEGQGGNVSLGDNPLVEQGVIINDLLGFGGGGLTWASRPRHNTIDEESAGRYGLRQGYEAYNGATNSGTIAESTKRAVETEHEPRRTFNLRALDEGDTFANLRLGDRVPLKLTSAGFMGGEIGMETVVRLVGMAHSDGDGAVELTCDEVTE